MKTIISGLFLALMVAGCTSSDPSQANRETCINAGHTPGTEAFDTCVEELVAQQLTRPSGAAVDDLRTRMGP